MDYSEIDKKISLASHGKEALSHIKTAYEMAKESHDYKKYVEYLQDYADELVFYDDVMELYIIYPTMLKANDKLVKEYGCNSHTRDTLWKYKWVLEYASLFYQISKEQFDLFFEDAKKRFLENNYSFRPLYQMRYVFYKNIDPKEAKKSYDEFLMEKRDRMSDCYACELSTEIKYLLSIDELDIALKKAEPLFNGKVSCKEEPEMTYGAFLRYYNEKIAEGYTKHTSTASSLCEILRRTILEQGIATEHIPDILFHYALTQPEKALDYYKKNWSFFEVSKTPLLKFYFAISAIRFLNNLGDREYYKMILPSSFPFYNESNKYNIFNLKTYYKDNAMDIAIKMDTRNGNKKYEELFIKLTSTH